MEQAVIKLENQMLDTNEKLDSIAITVKKVQESFVADDGKAFDTDVQNLLQSVKTAQIDYQNLRSEISEVQDLQKQLSSTLSLKMQLLQLKCNSLREKLGLNVPRNLPGVPNTILRTNKPSGETFHDDK